MTARSYHQVIARGPRSLGRLMRGGAVLVTLTLGLVIPPATFADCATSNGLALRAGMSPTERSIVLLEGRDPANVHAQQVTTDGLTLRAGLSATQRSIVMLEGQDPANFPVQDTIPAGLAVHAGMPSTQRSIALLEGRDPANFPATALGC